MSLLNNNLANQPSADADPSRPLVLHVRVVSGTGGGPEKTILNSPRFLTGLGYRAQCAYMHPPADPGFQQIIARAKESAAPLISIPDRGPLDPRVLTQLWRLCRRERVAIWHGHDYKSNALGLLLRKTYRMKLVTTVHGWVKFTRRTPLYYGVDRFCLRHYDRVICVSADLEQRCLEAGVPAERCLFIPNAIDCSQYQPAGVDQAAAKLAWNIPAGRLVIGAVGRLSAEKGFDLLIRAVAQLIGQGHDLCLLLVGEGDAEAELKALIAQLGQTDRIRLLGFQANLQPLYAALDIFALSSIREGLPNVLLEAMAMGLPSVATRIAGVPTAITDGSEGLLVEPADAGALTQALHTLVNDAALRQRLGAAARVRVEQQFSFARRMERVAALYDQVLGRQPAELPR